MVFAHVVPDSQTALPSAPLQESNARAGVGRHSNGAESLPNFTLVHYNEGHFPPGNMGPKVESVLRFLQNGGSEAVITSYEHLCEAVAGKSGTHILPDSYCTRLRIPERREVPAGGH